MIDLDLTDRESRLEKAGSEIANEIWGDIAFNHSLLCQVNLPYRNPGDEVREYERTTGKVSLQLEAGSIFTPGGRRSWRRVGLPYGPRARLLLLHLCSLAVKQQSPIVETEASFTAFCRSLGIATNGRNQKTVRDQIERMSAVSMRLGLDGSYQLVFQGMIFEAIKAVFTPHPDQLPIWSSEVRFSPHFYKSLSEHAVPLDVRAIKAIRHSARALDVYCWLASRLWRVPKPTRIRWTSLQYQFGSPSQDRRSFKNAFRRALNQVLAVYPKARVEYIRGGLMLRNSPPPIDFKDGGPQLMIGKD